MTCYLASSVLCHHLCCHPVTCKIDWYGFCSMGHPHHVFCTETSTPIWRHRCGRQRKGNSCIWYPAIKLYEDVTYTIVVFASKKPNHRFRLPLHTVHSEHFLKCIVYCNTPAIVWSNLQGITNRVIFWMQSSGYDDWQISRKQARIRKPTSQVHPYSMKITIPNTANLRLYSSQAQSDFKGISYLTSISTRCPWLRR